MLSSEVSKLMKEETISGFGHLDIEPGETIKTESWHEYAMSYACAKNIAPGGSLRITVPHFYTTPQIDDPSVVGYTCLAEENEAKAKVTINPTYSCFFTEDGHSGRFGKNIFVIFPEGLPANKKLVLKYGDISLPENRGAKAPFFACKAYFVTAIDPHGDRRASISGYSLLEEQIGVDVCGKTAQKATVILPSASNNETGRGIVHATDLNDNIDPYFTGEISLFATDNDIDLPKIITFAKEDKGVKEFTFKNKSGKDFRVEAECGDIVGTSNFCAGKRDDECNIYWGEYHVHTYASDGLGTIKDALDYGRKEAALDFAAINDHLDFREDVWDKIKAETEAANEPGRYVTFFGFEITAHPSVCDYCLISPDPNLNIKELMDCEKDERYHQPMIGVEKYYQAMTGRDVIIIPHFHLGNGKIWNYKAPPEMRLAEIYSCWGSHEYEDCARPSYGLPSIPENGDDKNTIHKLLNNKNRCGFVAGSDSHSGQTGKTKWLRSKQRYEGGLTAVLAKDLTRESIWEALNARRVYATTGARICLDFKINGQSMGSEIKVKKDSDISISLKVNGTETTFLTQIIKDNKTWRSFDVATYPYPPEPGREGIFEKETMDEKITESACYYLRATQIDGEMAWSSPIWVDVE